MARRPLPREAGVRQLGGDHQDQVHRGVTTNPAIFAAAMSKGTAYDSAIAALKEEGAKADDAVYSLAIDDVANACDLFAKHLQGI